MSASAQKPGAFTGKYPDTRKAAQSDDIFGTRVADPYRWLEDDMAEETKDWVTRQNVVTNAYLDQIPFRDAIRQRLTELWNYEKFSAPFKEGEYTYFFKNDGLQNQSVLFRQKKGTEPEVFLDPNKFSPDGTTSLAGIDFTKDGTLCAFQISEGGSDWRKVIIMDTRTRKQVDDSLMDVKFSGLSWKGNDGFYYSSYDKPKEGSQLSGKTQIHKLFYHKLGTPQTQDALIFGGEETPRRYVGGYVTVDQNFLVISAANATYGNELYIQDLTMTKAPERWEATWENNLAAARLADAAGLEFLLPVARWHGYRGETDTLEKMKSRIDYDLYYIDNWSLLFDLQIVALTLFSGKTYTNAG